MPDDDQKPTAGFLGGRAPEPSRPDAEKAPEETSPPAARPGGAAGFLGGQAAAPQPPAAPPASAEPRQGADAPAEAAPAQPQQPEEPQPPQSPAPPEASAPASAAAETLQPMPDPSAPAGAFFARAEELVGEGHLNSAVTAYRKGLEKAPDDAVALNNLAMVFIELERYNDARIELERALEAGGGEMGDIYNNLGYVLRRIGNEPAAADAYEHYLAASEAVDPEEAGAIREWIASVRADAPAPEPAPADTASARPATADAPPAGDAPAGPSLQENEASFIRKAEALYEQEDFEGAITVYNNLLARSPDCVLALEGRGRAQIKAGLVEEGVASLREADTLSPPTAERLYVLGFALRSIGRDAEAADTYEAFLQMDPDAENADRIREWIAEVRSAAPAEAPPAEPAAEAPSAPEGEAGGETPSWMDALAGDETGETQADAPALRIEDAPPEAPPAEPEAPAAGSVFAAAAPAAAPQEEPPPSLDEAEAAFADGRTDEALAAAQRVAAAAPDDPAARILIARCFGRQGDFQKAIPILETLLRQTPDRPEAWFLLGRCRQETGDAQAARTAFEKVAEVAPESEVAERAREILQNLGGGERRERSTALCEGCMESVPGETLNDVEGKMLCPECREQLEEALGGRERMDEAEQEVRIAKHLATDTKRLRRRRRRRVHPVLVVLVLLVALGLGGLGGLIALKQTHPQIYHRLAGGYGGPPAPPPDDGFAPPPDDTSGRTAGRGDDDDWTEEWDALPPGDDGAARVGAGPTRPPAEPKVELDITGAPPARAMAGFRYRYTLAVEPADVEKKTHAVAFAGEEPFGPYRMDAETGAFVWKPFPEDAGKRFEIIYRCSAEEADAPAEQRVTVRVLPTPSARLIAEVEPLPIRAGEPAHLLCTDADGDGSADLVLASGAYGEARVAVRRRTAGGWTAAPQTPLAGHPVGAAALDPFEDRPGVAVADWRGKAVRIYRWSADRLRETAAFALPARPLLLSAMNRGEENRLAVCLAGGTVLTLSADGRGGLRRGREYGLPERRPYRRIALADFNDDKGADGPELALVTLGQEAQNVRIRPLGENGSWTGMQFGRGVVETAVAAAFDTDRARAGVALATAYETTGEGAQHQLAARLSLGEEGWRTARTDRIGGAVFAATAADLDGDGLRDLLFIGRSRAWLWRHTAGEGLSEGNEALALPLDDGVAPSSAAAAGDLTGDGVEDAVFIDRAGRAVLITLHGVEGVPAEETP